MDDVDQILVTERSVEPTPRFARDVMRAVHHQARRLTFPWRYALAGIIMLALVIVGAFVLPQGRLVQICARSLVLWSMLLAVGCVLFVRVVLDASEP
jgi:hypothetical protein